MQILHFEKFIKFSDNETDVIECIRSEEAKQKSTKDNPVAILKRWRVCLKITKHFVKILKAAHTVKPLNFSCSTLILYTYITVYQEA